MAAQTDSKDRAKPLYGKKILEHLPQIKDLGFPKIFAHIPWFSVFGAPPYYIARKKVKWSGFPEWNLKKISDRKKREALKKAWNWFNQNIFLLTKVSQVKIHKRDLT